MRPPSRHASETFSPLGQVSISGLRQQLDAFNKPLSGTHSQMLYLKEGTLNLGSLPQKTHKKESRLDSPTPSIFVHQAVLKIVKTKLKESLKQLDDEDNISEVKAALTNIRTLSEAKTAVGLAHLLTQLNPIKELHLEQSYEVNLAAQCMIFDSVAPKRENIDKVVTFLNEANKFVTHNKNKNKNRNLEIRRGKTKTNQIILYLSDKDLSLKAKENIQNIQNRKGQMAKTANKGADSALDFFKEFKRTIVENDDHVLSAPIVHKLAAKLHTEEKPTITSFQAFFDDVRRALVSEEARQPTSVGGPIQPSTSTNQEIKAPGTAPAGTSGRTDASTEALPKDRKNKKKKNKVRSLAQMVSKISKEKSKKMQEQEPTTAEVNISAAFSTTHRPHTHLPTVASNQPVEKEKNKLTGAPLIRESTTDTLLALPESSAALNHLIPQQHLAPPLVPQQNSNPVVQFFSRIGSIVSNFFRSLFFRS